MQKGNERALDSKLPLGCLLSYQSFNLDTTPCNAIPCLSRETPSHSPKPPHVNPDPAPFPIRYLQSPFYDQNYIWTCRASFGWLSAGQYGHLKRPWFLLSLYSVSLATTCPHGIIMGGLLSVACSLLTGHTKMA